MSPFDAEYEPSPWEPIAEEVARYERSGGSEASDLVGDEWIILWTVGAQSGKVRKTPLVRVADGDGNYAVVGSMGGAPTHPQWVHNVRAQPVARLQDGAPIAGMRPRFEHVRRSEDAREGAAAFLERRPPRFSGR